MDFLIAPRAELIRLIYELVDENQALKIQIAELKVQLERKSPPQEKKSLPSLVKPNVKIRLKKERKPRHQGFARALDLPNQKVFHAYETCPICNGRLGKPSVAYTRQIIDIPLPKAVVTEHIVYKRWCRHCGKRVYPKVNLTSLVVGKQRMGINLMALAATLRQRLNQPLNRIQEYLKIVYRLDISEGELMKILYRAVGLGKPYYLKILANLKSSPTVYADETGGRENGLNGYHWSFSNERCQYLLYRRSRGKKVIREVFGEDGKDFDGVLVSDFYTAYNEHCGFHQRCWVHLLRDIHNLVELYPKNKKLSLWAKEVEAVLEEAKAYPGPSPNLPLGLQAQERINQESYSKEKLQNLCEPYVTQNVPMATLCSRIVTYLSELFTFVRFPGVSPDNNLAERALRQTVIQRKIFGGTRTPRGSEAQSILSSLFGTWRLQGLNPLEEMRLLLARAPCQGT